MSALANSTVCFLSRYNFFASSPFIRSRSASTSSSCSLRLIVRAPLPGVHCRVTSQCRLRVRGADDDPLRGCSQASAFLAVALLSAFHLRTGSVIALLLLLPAPGRRRQPSRQRSGWWL